MALPPDTKPSLTGSNALHSPTNPLPDIKPTLPTSTRYKDSIDFTDEVKSIRQERERLEEKHQLHKSVLDLREEMLKVKEENRRLREGRTIVRPGPGLTEVKPDISGLACRLGSNSALVRSADVDVEGDDDDVIFVSENKTGTTQCMVNVKPGQSSC